MFKIDLHIHTANSYDAVGSPDQVLTAAKEAGLDGIAVTEHHTYERSESFLKLAPEFGLRVFVGAEVGTRYGHLLVFSELIRRWNRFEGYLNNPQEVIDEVNSVGGAVVAAHPFRMALGFGGAGVQRLCGLAAIEGCNGSNSEDENRRAIKLAEQMALPCTGGSDAHRPAEIGRCYTIFESPVLNMPELIFALKAGCFRSFPSP